MPRRLRARGVLHSLPPNPRGRAERRVRGAPVSPVCRSSEKELHTRQLGPPASPASRAQWASGLLCVNPRERRLSAVSIVRVARPDGDGRLAPAVSCPAPRCSKAEHQFVQLGPSVAAARVKRSRPVHRSPPRVVDVANAPSRRGGLRRTIYLLGILSRAGTRNILKIDAWWKRLWEGYQRASPQPLEGGRSERRVRYDASASLIRAMLAVGSKIEVPSINLRFDCYK